MITDAITQHDAHLRSLMLDAQLMLLDEQRRQVHDLIHDAERALQAALASGTPERITTAGQRLAGAHAALAFITHATQIARGELLTIHHRYPPGGEGAREEARTR